MTSLLLTLVMAAPIVTEVTPPADPAPAAATSVATPNDVVGWVLADVATLAKSDPNAVPFVRYLWIPPWGEASWQGGINYVVNLSASHAATIQHPHQAAGGWLLRYDLRRLAPRDEQLAALITTWDSLATSDPYFHVPSPDRKTAILGPHIDLDRSAMLVKATGAAAPVLRADWFLAQALTTADGGRYYDFRQYNRKPAQGTAEAAILASVGADIELSKRVNGDRRVALFESQVTGKARRVDAGQGAIGDWWITHDIFDEDADVARHPIYNLLAFFDRGREGIYELPNGLHGFFLSDNTGALVNEAPPNLASDHNIPRPHTKRLQVAISCIRCHGEDGGLKTTDNDVATILALRPGERPADIFDDLGNLDAERRENLDRLASLYAGNFQTRIKNGRIKYADAVFAATGGMKPAEAANVVSEIFASQAYAKVTPQQACLELGRKVDAQASVATIKELLPVLPNTLVVEGRAFPQEDPTFLMLKAGKSVRRADWDRVFVDAMYRARVAAGEIKVEASK